MKVKLGIVITVLGISILLLIYGCMAINSAPVASFTSSPSSGEAPLTVSFDASNSYDSDGEIVSYSWLFGDGNSGTSRKTSHTYGGAGNYSATLTVRDGEGASASLTHMVTVTGVTPSPQPPSPDYNVTVGQIINEFDSNEVAAEMKYEGKLIAISGYIRNFGTYFINDEPIVHLNKHLGGSAFDDEVLCYFPYERRASVAQLSKGDYVTIVGEYWMYGLGNVYLHYCYIP